jgi:hypothetical protein
LIPLLVEHTWALKRSGVGEREERGRLNTQGTEEERRVHEEKKEKAQAEGLSYGEWRRW